MNFLINKQKTITCLLGLFLTLFLSSHAFAKAYPNFYRGLRPLGMGNAFTAISDDENALFYNPAGLAEISSFSLGLINPIIELSEGSIDLYNDSEDIDTDDSGQVADLLSKYVGEHQHARVSLFPYAGFPVAQCGVMIGYLGQATLDAEIRNPVWPEVETSYIVDHGILAGIGGRIPSSKIRIGAAVKYINRESLDETYTAADIADDNFDDQFEDDLENGSNLAFDLGVLYTPPFDWPVETHIGLTIQNLPEMDFGQAQDQQTQTNIGLALEKRFGNYKLLGALDYRDLTSAIEEDDDIPKRLHMGVELQLPKILSVRAGLNQGYVTYGLTLDIWLIKLDFAAYSEEVGAHAGQREDRRYVGQLTIGW
ncbi:MAG: conjugal transfer protein TraF [Desulfobacteraceae bacterium]|jgi:hypothetical protein